MTQTAKKENLIRLKAKLKTSPIAKARAGTLCQHGWEAMDEFERNQGSSGWVFSSHSHFL